MGEEDQKQQSSPSFSVPISIPDPSLACSPDCYILPLSQRPNPRLEPVQSPLIDLSHLHRSLADRSLLVQDVGDACRQWGFFQVINHGICGKVLEGALGCASDFFELPKEEKMKLMSGDVSKPVRYGASLNHVMDKVQFWRVFLKHYAHPMSKWLHFWPSNPPDYKEKMGKYCAEVRTVGLELLGVIMESLGLESTYLREKLEVGLQLMAVNCYPACPQPELVLGLPPHSDFGFLTVLLQDCEGLQVMDSSVNEWRAVPDVMGCLHVQLGDQLEVMSNGRFKSLVHRAAVNSERRRLSIASVLSLDMDEKVATAKELVDEQHPQVYRESSFKGFLEFLSTHDVGGQDKTFLDTLRIINT